MKKTKNSLIEKLKHENYILEKIYIFNSYDTKISALTNRIKDIKQGLKNKTLENLQSIETDLIDSSFKLDYSKVHHFGDIKYLNLEKHLEYEKKVIPLDIELSRLFGLLIKQKKRKKISSVIFLIYIPIQIFFEYLLGLWGFMILGRLIGIGLFFYLIFQWIRYNSIDKEIDILWEKRYKTKANIV